MSDLPALREVEGIRVRRVASAEDALRAAQQAQRQAEQALQEAELALADYQQKLPGLIEQLYVDCIGQLVSREYVQEKVQEEAALRARVEDFKAKVTEAQGRLDKARDAVVQAQLRLQQERIKLDAMRDLLREEKKKLVLAAARSDAKVLDELAGAKFVRARLAHQLH